MKSQRSENDQLVILIAKSALTAAKVDAAMTNLEEKLRRLGELAQGEPMSNRHSDCFPCKHARTLIDVARAAKKYRDKVDYTGGDGTMFFEEERKILDEALAKLGE